MNKRIRYIKDEHGGWKSMKVIKSAEGIEYIAVINPDGKTGFIKCPRNNALNLQVKATSLHKVKIALKTNLEFLKCKFAKETRTTSKDKQHENLETLNSIATSSNISDTIGNGTSGESE